ncbi:MAG: hypothetical protein ACI8RZ_007356, partial [Myxococcota bacterium]
ARRWRVHPGYADRINRSQKDIYLPVFIFETVF